MTLAERISVVLATLSLACALVLIALFQGIMPWSEQPILLNTSSELAGEISILLPSDDDMSFETTVENLNGIPLTIRTKVDSYPSQDAARAAHVEATNAWLADDTAGGR